MNLIIVLLPIFSGILLGLFYLYAIKKWEAVFYVGDKCVDIKTYEIKSLFFSPFRKIYRPKRFASEKFEFDIFILKEFSRFNKEMTYYLADLDDQPEITQQLKENQNGEGN